MAKKLKGKHSQDRDQAVADVNTSASQWMADGKLAKGAGLFQLRSNKSVVLDNYASLGGLIQDLQKTHGCTLGSLPRHLSVWLLRGGRLQRIAGLA
jgi:hypothetical protein